MINYLICYDYNNYDFITARDEKNCILSFAKYVGCNTKLFEKALSGCINLQDCIDMYNQFSSYQIDKIVIVDKILYDREAKNND